MVVLIVILAIVVVLAIAAIVLYNNLVRLKNRVLNAWSQIEVQLQRRADLIPNLVRTVKGYASHEKRVFEEVNDARERLMSASTPEQAVETDDRLTQSLGRLFALAEAYPDLKASANFQELQSELSKTEDRISYMRQSYNDTVMRYDTALQTFPGVLFAGAFPRFQSFTAQEHATSVPQVSFE